MFDSNLPYELWIDASNFAMGRSFVAGGFWAVILSRAAWKKSWAGRDPTRSIIPTDRSVAITGDTARAQLLTA